MPVENESNKLSIDAPLVEEEGGCFVVLFLLLVFLDVAVVLS